MLGTFDEFMRRVGFAICALVFPILCYISCTKKTKPRAVESFYDVTAPVSNPHAGDANKAATGNKVSFNFYIFTLIFSPFSGSASGRR